MANSINYFMDNMRLNEVNSLTHLLNTEDSDELNIIRHSPYFSDDDLLQSSTCHKNGLSILSLNCQSLHAKFDYIKLLIDKFVANNSPLQVLCLQESWFSSDTDLSPYMISGYHLISTGHYASNHGGLVIYLNQRFPTGGEFPPRGEFCISQGGNSSLPKFKKNYAQYETETILELMICRETYMAN